MNTNKPLVSDTNVVNEIIGLWSFVFTERGYTGGYLNELTQVCIQTEACAAEVKDRTRKLRPEIVRITDPDLRELGLRLMEMLDAVFSATRPSTCVTACGDGVFYILVKKDKDASWVPAYVESIVEALDVEIDRWQGKPIPIEVRRECLDAATYLRGCVGQLTLDPTLLSKVNLRIERYRNLFWEEGLDTDDSSALLALFEKAGGPPFAAAGYPDILNDQFNLGTTPQSLEDIALRSLEEDMKTVKESCRELAASLGVSPDSKVKEVWGAASKKYAVGDEAVMAKKVEDIACVAFGNERIIQIDSSDNVSYEATPSYLAPLVTGGEDRAVDYLTESPKAMLYYTPGKNSSLLTMINIIVHEASHGYNFVKAAQHAGSPLLNLFTPLVEAATEGQAFHREWEYWKAAEEVLGKEDPSDVERQYLALYGKTPEEQQLAVACAKLETYIWRVLRYIRALYDVKVNGGIMTHVEFVDWAAGMTELDPVTIHEECFTFLSQPGYAPCYMLGYLVYAKQQECAAERGVSQRDFNTRASNLGFFPWYPTGIAKLKELV